MFIKKFITVVVLVYLYSQMVLCTPIHNIKVPSHSQNTPTNSVKLKLYNIGSMNFVKITDTAITADGQINDTFVLLEMRSSEAPTNLTITVMGVESKRFMCFNKRGELKSRRKGHRKLCKFTDSLKPGYRLTSVYNKNWQVAFKPDGKPVMGKARKKEDWLEFVRMDPTRPLDLHPCNSNTICFKNIVLAVKEKDRAKQRDEKQRNRRRRRRRSTSRAAVQMTTVVHRRIRDALLTPTTTVLPIR